MDEIEDTMAAAELLRLMVTDANARSAEPRCVVEHRCADDLVEVSGFGFGMTIDGEQYVVCVEKV